LMMCRQTRLYRLKNFLKGVFSAFLYDFSANTGVFLILHALDTVVLGNFKGTD
jgi:hypothetical protein